MQPPTAKIKQISKNLYLISLTPLIRGFDNFISVWLYKGKNKTFIIDVGPSVTSTSLKIALKELEVKRLDYIFLTHIHLDHAAGLEIYLLAILRRLLFVTRQVWITWSNLNF